MALLERLEIVIEADARTAEREFERIGRQAEESLGSIETAAGEVGENASKRLAGTAAEFARAGEKLSDAAGEQLDFSAAAREAAADVSRALESQRQEAGQSGRRLGDAAGRGVAEGVRDAGSQVRAAGGQAGAAAGDGVSDGLLGSLGDLSNGLGGALDDALGALPAGVAGPVAAAGALIGAGLVNGISDAIENENLGDVIAARVGEGAAESERFARVTSNVFRDAWGESTAEVADAVDAVYSTLADSRGSEEALQDLTERAQAFAQVFNQDVGQAVSNAGVLIETGLADDAVEAFDLMTAAAQRVPAAMRDELGEATQEYSTFFAALGFDGRESFAILTDAAQEGRYELDKTGDAMKELSIRATDLADTAAVQALEDLGLNARTTANDLLAGGDAAREATQRILEALSQVPEPARQAELAIALMGAPLEDLNKQEIPEFIDRLANASSGMRDAEGASDELVDSLDNQATAFTKVKREMLGFFEAYANQRLTPLSELIEEDDPGLGDYGVAAGKTVGTSFLEYLKITVGGAPGFIAEQAFGDDPEGEAEELGFATGQAFARGLTAAQAAQATGNGTGFVMDGSVDWEFDDSFPFLFQNGRWVNPEVGVDVTANTAEAKTALEEINREIELSGDLFELAADRADNYLSRIAGSTNLDDAISAQLDLRDAAAQLADGLGALQGVDIEAFAEGTIQVSNEAADALGDISGAASAAQQQIANALEWEGEAGALETAGELRDRFVQLFDAAGLTDEQIIDLLASMGLLPEQVTTAIELSGADEALAKLDLLSGRYEEEIPAEVQTQIDIAIAEGRFVDAANLLSLWVKDKEDGFINDPLLIAMGLGDTDPASGEVEAWKAEEERKRAANIPVGADTGPARTAIGGLMRDIGLLRPVVQVAAQITSGADRIAGAAVASAEVRTGQDINGNGIVGRAVGGPVMGDTPYMVNERGSELFVPSTPGFVMDHSESRALIEGVRQLVNGGGSGVVVNQQITSTDPIVTARESARKMRDAQYLAGV